MSLAVVQIDWGLYQSVLLCLFPGPKDLLSDRCILSCPSMDLVTCLLDFRLNFASNRSIVPRLAASLAACAQLSALGTQKPLRTQVVVLTILSSKNTPVHCHMVVFRLYYTLNLH